MAPSLSIKNVPEDVVERLRDRAKRNRRSLQGELLAILEETTRPRGLSVDQVYQRIKALNFQTPSESTAWIREDRDAR